MFRNANEKTFTEKGNFRLTTFHQTEKAFCLAFRLTFNEQNKKSEIYSKIDFDWLVSNLFY